jgi:hypothetical protein
MRYEERDPVPLFTLSFKAPIFFARSNKKLHPGDKEIDSLPD